MAVRVGLAAALACVCGQREWPADEGASAAAGLAADYRAGLRLLHVIPGDEAPAGQHEAEHDDEQDAAEGRHGANLEQIRVGWNRLQRSIDPANLLYPFEVDRIHVVIWNRGTVPSEPAQISCPPTRPAMRPAVAARR